MERSSVQRRISRILLWIGDVTSRSVVTAIVVMLVLAFGSVLAIFQFPVNWETDFSAVAGAITLVMLFVIQHTQNRNQVVLQLKLDELIRSSPQADDLLVHLEVADDEELIKLEQSQVAHHESVRVEDGLSVIEFNRNE